MKIHITNSLRGGARSQRHSSLRWGAFFPLFLEVGWLRLINGPALLLGLLILLKP